MSGREELERQICDEAKKRHAAFLPGMEADLLITAEVQAEMEALIDEDDKEG